MSGAVLWYVHHHGTGHWRRAIAVAELLPLPVLFASSAPPPWKLPADAAFCELPGDVPDAVVGDPTATGALHWAPERHPGLLRRNSELLRLAAGSRLAVVDVSVEAGVLLRVSGIPVIAVRLPGDRTDPPHRLLHQVACEVVMPVPASWSLGSTPLGLVSGLQGPGSSTDPGGPVVVVRGGGGSAITEPDIDCLRRAVGSRPVVVAAGKIAPLLAAASVVVGGTGLGTVADVSRAGRPFVGLPDERPFGEQLATARALAAHEAACIPPGVPADEAAWCAALSEAVRRGPLRADTGGAGRFAQLVEAAA